MRLSRASADRHTWQSHPIMGTPVEVPVPRNVKVTECVSSLALGNQKACFRVASPYRFSLGLTAFCRYVGHLQLIQDIGEEFRFL